MMLFHGKVLFSSVWFYKVCRYNCAYFSSLEMASCERCGDVFSGRQVLHRHIQKVHAPKKLCWYCDYTITRPYMMRNHLKSCHPYARIHGTVEGLFRPESEPVLREPIDELFATPPPPPQKIIARCSNKVKSTVHVVKKKVIKSVVRRVDTQNDVVAGDVEGEDVNGVRLDDRTEAGTGAHEDDNSGGDRVDGEVGAGDGNEDIDGSIPTVKVVNVRLHKCDGAFPPLAPKPKAVFVVLPTLPTSTVSTSFRKMGSDCFAERTSEFARRSRCSAGEVMTAVDRVATVGAVEIPEVDTVGAVENPEGD